ncbi:MAG: KpsF/GutQ family sugar-phosphate isomerase, partial [Brevundimonas sp.]|nr:KpsF/GutQ family sugar-phosphate isomerase [Brevundimonas sp.]
MGHIASMTNEASPALSADPAAMTARAREVIRLNIAALQTLESGLDDGIARACEVILSRPGYLIVTGMGKS